MTLYPLPAYEYYDRAPEADTFDGQSSWTRLWIMRMWWWIIDRTIGGESWGLASPNFINFMRIQQHLQISQIANVWNTESPKRRTQDEAHRTIYVSVGRLVERHSQPFDRKWQVSKIGPLTFGSRWWMGMGMGMVPFFYSLHAPPPY